MSKNWEAFATFADSVFRSLTQAFHRTSKAFFSSIAALRKACLWVYRLPGRILAALNHAISISVAAMLFALKVIGWIAATGLLVVVLFYAGRLGFHLWRDYRRRLDQNRADLQHQHLAARAQRFLAEEQIRRAQQHAAWERGRRQREAAERAARVQARPTDNTMRDALRREALRAQQQKEDVRLYHQWRKACDETFHHPTTTTSLPLPPSLPCTELDCHPSETTRTCTHRMKRLLLGAGVSQPKGGSSQFRSLLIAERLRWHPDRSCIIQMQKCQVPNATVFATEVFQIFDDLLMEC